MKKQTERQKDWVIKTEGRKEGGNEKGREGGKWEDERKKMVQILL